MKLKSLLIEAETFTATNKKSGKVSVFKSKETRDAAVKAGTHAAIKEPKGSKAPTKGGVNIFDKPEKKKKEEPKSEKPVSKNLGVDKVVYNTRTKTVGIVRMADERGETKTDADGNVNTSELEPYNPMKYPHQKDAKVAPSTSKEIQSRSLWTPFAPDEDTPSKEEPKKDEPKSQQPAIYNQRRTGNPQVNKSVKSLAEKGGFTPDKLGKEEYKTKMMQAAVSALSDANFHQEARELVAKLEGKPEWAKKPEYPGFSDPQYDEKMKAIRANSSEASKYMQPDGKTWEFGREVAEKAEWGGVEAIDGLAFTLRMNGFHKEADTIQSIFDDKPYMKETTSLKSLLPKK